MFFLLSLMVLLSHLYTRCKNTRKIYYNLCHNVMELNFYFNLKRDDHKKYYFQYSQLHYLLMLNKTNLAFYKLHTTIYQCMHTSNLITYPLQCTYLRGWKEHRSHPAMRNASERRRKHFLIINLYRIDNDNLQLTRWWANK